MGHPRDAGVQLGAAGVVARGGDGGAGEQVEQRRLAALGETDEPDLHTLDYSGPPVTERRDLDLSAALLALLLSLFWGGNPVAVKLGLEDAPPLRLAWVPCAARGAALVRGGG